MTWLIERISHLGPEFVGGGVAYWTHHFFHRLWSARFPFKFRKHA